MSDDIKNKIRKLLALANDKAATEDEAATAMRMAMGLMAKHGIEQSQIGGEPPAAKKGAKVNDRFEKYQIIMAGAAGHLFGCKVVMIDRGKQGLYFVGRPDNIDASEATLFFLLGQLERLYKVALPPGLTQRQRSEFRKTFKQACAIRVMQRAHALVAEMQSNDVAAKGSTGKNALVVKGYFDQMFAEADAEIAGMNVKKTKWKDPKTDSGTAQGLVAGDHVKLRRELNT